MGEREMSAMSRQSQGAARFLWRDIAYEIDQKKAETKRILNTMYGYVDSGQVLAIMGASGAGKTSLMNILAGRVSNGRTTGEVMVNNTILTAKQFKRRCGYVMQDDTHAAFLTVRETLTFAARMRLPSSVSEETKLARVDALIAELGLVDCADTRIGNDLRRGISGGQKKRVSIAVELIGDPDVLLLDEPTSGLDSFTAANVMETLRALASNNRVVLTTIHQPRSKVFHLFDRLLLLADGDMVYFGRADACVDYMGRLGYQCPIDANPADFFLDVSSFDHRSDEQSTESVKRVAGLLKHFQSSPERRELVDAVHTLHEADPIGEEEDGRYNETADDSIHMDTLSRQGSRVPLHRSVLEAARPLTLLQQMRYLLLFHRMNYWRNLPMIVSETIRATTLGIFIGLVFLQVENNQAGVRDRQGLLFSLTINEGVTSVFAAMRVFSVDLAVYRRERAAGTYQVFPYFLTRVLVNLPVQILPTIVLSSVVYWMVGLQAVFTKWLIFTFTLLSVSYTGACAGLLIGALVSRREIAGALGAVLIVLQVLLSGLLINLKHIPDYFVWFYYINWNAYAYRVLTLNEFTGLTLTGCSPTESNCFENGDEVLEFFGFESGPGIALWLCLLVLESFIFLLLTYFVLRRKRPFPNQAKLRVDTQKDFASGSINHTRNAMKATMESSVPNLLHRARRRKHDDDTRADDDYAAAALPSLARDDYELPFDWGNFQMRELIAETEV